MLLLSTLNIFVSFIFTLADYLVWLGKKALIVSFPDGAMTIDLNLSVLSSRLLYKISWNVND